MDTELLRSQTAPSPILDSYEAYGCKVNALRPSELFRKYEEAGFLYPAKMELLSPYMDEVKENWRRGLRGGETILWVATFDDPDDGVWASVSSWRSTSAGWNTQHLIGMGSPVGSRAVMLGGPAVRINDGFDDSHQNWFRPENRFPQKVFGSLVEAIGLRHASVATFNYLALRLPIKTADARNVFVKERQNGHCSELLALAQKARGHVYASAEELGQEDLLLEGVDELYRRVGLRRYRRIWMAYLSKREGPVGAAIVYRGPLGFNFSFIENRCDIITIPGLSDSEVGIVVWTLVRAASAAYTNFPPGSIPVVADANVTPCLVKAGAHVLRKYSQSIWLREGFIGWYRHVEKFYDRIIGANKRHGLGVKRRVSTEPPKNGCSSNAL